jgi:hypothetical protein
MKLLYNIVKIAYVFIVNFSIDRAITGTPESTLIENFQEPNNINNEKVQ